MNAERLDRQRTPPIDRHGLVGSVVSRRFRVLDLCHGGPHGSVYEVEPPGVGRARRALKTLDLPEARFPGAVERLRHYVEATRDLDHPNLERLYGVEALPDGTPFILSEWVALASLDDHLSHHGSLPLARALDVLRGIAAGLAALHTRGVPHGDLRPAHVLVAPSRFGFDRVLLIDAAVAPSLDPRPGPALDDGLIFRAPERIAGRPPSPAADVYALGVLGWTLLTGRAPFLPDDVRCAQLGPDPAARVRWLHLHAAPVRPAQVIERPLFGPALEAVIGRAMAKRPTERFPDARAFLEAFEEALAPMDAADLLEACDSLVLELFDQTPAPPAALDATATLGEAATPPHLARAVTSARGAALRPVSFWLAAGAITGAALAVLRALL